MQRHHYVAVTLPQNFCCSVYISAPDSGPIAFQKWASSLKQMVREFGPARAEELLREFRVEQR